MNQVVTNKDAKIIYSKYWFKNMSLEMFPTIYVDEYWEYTIDLFNLREDWEWFLEQFNNEFSSAREYIEESERIKDVLEERFFTSDITDKLNSYKMDKRHFAFKYTYDFPDGEYWVIDLDSAFNQTLEYLGVIQPGVSYQSVVEETTKSKLLCKSKVLRIQLYYRLKVPFKNIMYNVCDKLLYNLSQTPEFQSKINFEDIIGICGDSLYIPKNKVNLVEGDYEISGIKFHIRNKRIKSIIYKGETIKWLETDTVNFFYKNNYPQYVSTDEYLCLMKTIKNQQINQLDLTVGFEEQIFYVNDYD